MELAKVDLEEAVLARFDKAVHALEQARTLDEILAIRDIAEAARVWAKAAQRGRVAVNYAAEIKLRAERKAGELLAQLKRGEAKKVRSANGRLYTVPAPESVSGSGRRSEYREALQSIGSTSPGDGVERVAQTWQVEAKVPQDVFERYIDAAKSDYTHELTQAGVLGLLPKRGKEPKEPKTWLQQLEALADQINALEIPPQAIEDPAARGVLEYLDTTVQALRNTVERQYTLAEYQTG